MVGTVPHMILMFGCKSGELDHFRFQGQLRPTTVYRETFVGMFTDRIAGFLTFNMHVLASLIDMI